MNKSLTKLNEDEKQEILSKFLPKIKFWVLKYKNIVPVGVDIDELYSSACLGLVEAMNNYQKNRAKTFEIYAEKRIKGAILDCLRKMDHLPRNVRNVLKELENSISVLGKQIGRVPEFSEIADYTKLDEPTLRKYLTLIENDQMVRLNGSVSDDKGDDLIDLIKSCIDTPDNIIEKKELVDIIGSLIDKLPNNERLVVILYYYEELTMKEIGIVLELTESRISQLHSLALKKIGKGIKNVYK